MMATFDGRRGACTHRTLTKQARSWQRFDIRCEIVLNTRTQAVAYIGDDLPDIPLLRRAGLAIAVGNAVPEVKQAAHYTTKTLPGHGAVREAVELILRSKGIWETMIDKARA